jgi:hypothetical protein
MTPLPEGHIVAYHPGLDQSAVVPATAMRELRAGGWLTRDEHRANVAEQASAQDEPGDGAAPRPAGGSPPATAAAKGARAGQEK